MTRNQRQPLLSYLTLPSVAILKTGPCFPICLLSSRAPAARPAKRLISAEFLPPHLTASPLRVCCHLGAYCSRHRAPGLENPFPAEARELFGACDPVGAGQTGVRFSCPEWLWRVLPWVRREWRQGLTHHPGGLGQALEHICSQHSSRPHQPPGILMRVSCDCRFLAVRAGRSPLSSVTGARHTEIAISACHQGPSLSSWTRWERLCLLLHPLTWPFSALRPEMSFSLFESRIPLSSHPSAGLHILVREAMAHGRQTKPKWGRCTAA